MEEGAAAEHVVTTPELYRARLEKLDQLETNFTDYQTRLETLHKNYERDLAELKKEFERDFEENTCSNGRTEGILFGHKEEFEPSLSERPTAEKRFQ